jgi:hypothetical protein
MPEPELFAELLLWAVQREAGVARDYPLKVLALYDRLNERFPRIDERVLAAMQREGAVDLLEDGRFIYLETNKKASWTIPILGLKYDFAGDRHVVRLRLAFFGLVRDDEPLVAVGMRFETPEGGGFHNYYHAQLINSFSKGVEDHQLPGAGWVPQRFPAVPLDATSPTTLLLGTLLSLYGLGYLRLLQDAGLSSAFWAAVAGVRYRQRAAETG